MGGVDGDKVWSEFCACILSCYDYSDPVKVLRCLDACADGSAPEVIDVACRGDGDVRGDR